MIRPSRSFDSKTFATFRLAKSERRTELSITIAGWVIIAALVIALLVLLTGCSGSGTGGQPAEPQWVNPCACAYELELGGDSMKVLCKPCPEAK